MDDGRIGHGGGSVQAAAGASSSLDAQDHTRLWLQSKLSGDWSAQAGASGLTEERLNALSRCFGTLDSMVKVRLLLAGLFVPGRERSRLQPLLADLSSQAAGNQDEWVRATAAAVGDFSGMMDMRSLMSQFPLVRESVMRFSAQLAELSAPPALLPQTEQYMHKDISRLPTAAAAAASAAAGGAGGSGRLHCRLREAAQSSAGEAGALGGSGSLLLGLSPSGLGLDSRVSLWPGSGPGPGPGGDSLLRRGLSSGPGSGETSSMLRSRSNVTHNKEPKQAPPTPSAGKPLALTGPPALAAMRLGRSRSLVGPEQQLQLPSVPESPRGGTTPGAAAGTPFGAAAGAAAAAAVATVASGAAGTATSSSGGGGGALSQLSAGGPSGSGSLPPLPQLQSSHSQSAGAPAGGALSGRGSEALPGVTPRTGSWQGGGGGGGAAAATGTAQQYPLAAAIAFAAAAASGEALTSASGSGQFNTSNLLSYFQQQQQQRHGDEEPPSSGRESYGVSGGDRDFGGRPEALDEHVGQQVFERVSFGEGATRQWSVPGNGSGWHGDASASADERRPGNEPDAKRPRSG